MKAKCHNMEKKDAVFSKEHLCGGKIIESFIPTCEEDGFTLLQRKRGIRLIFAGLEPKLDWFPVPCFWVLLRMKRAALLLMEKESWKTAPFIMCQQKISAGIWQKISGNLSGW